MLQATLRCPSYLSMKMSPGLWHQSIVRSSSCSSPSSSFVGPISSFHIVNSVCWSHALVSGLTSKRPASDGGICSGQRHCPPVPTSSWMLCTDRTQFAACQVFSTQIFSLDAFSWVRFNSIQFNSIQFNTFYLPVDPLYVIVSM